MERGDLLHYFFAKFFMNSSELYQRFVEANNNNNQQQQQQNNNNNNNAGNNKQNLFQKAGNWVSDKVDDAKQAVANKVDDMKDAAVSKVMGPLKGTLEKAVGAGIIAAPFALDLYNQIKGGMGSGEDVDGDGKVDDQLVASLKNQIDTQFSTDVKVLYNKAKNCKSDYAQKVLTQLQPLVDGN
jgi:hypothetical protein